MTRTIQFDMTWTAAAQIIAAALENGTNTGRDAARAELFRMASILDALRNETAADRWEVIASQPQRVAYGVAFATEQQAQLYASRMQAHGFDVDLLECPPTETAHGALKDAAHYFAAPILTGPAYLIANESDQTEGTFRKGTEWTTDEATATRYPTEAAARAALEQIQLGRAAGADGLAIWREIIGPDGRPAHAEVTA